MAKKRLSTVAKVTTAGENDYIVINTSDGKVMQIKKSDLAGALASVMQTAVIKDFDKVMNPGQYFVANNYSNYPPAAWTYGVLLVFGAGETFTMQIYNDTNSSLFNRVYCNGAWQSWKKII